MWGHFRALLGLKWSILRHTWTGRKAASSLFGIILIAVVAVAASGAAVLLNRAAAGGLGDASPKQILLLLDGITAGFLFFWLWGLLMELQRADVIDFRKMLFLPVSLHMVYGLNYLASLFSPGLVLFSFAATGLLLGFAQARGPVMLLGFAPAAAFFLMLAAWAYYVRGLIAMVMENQRRRRTVLALIPLFIIILAQLPQVLSIALRHQNHPGAAIVPDWIAAANLAVPLGWLPFSLYCLVRDDVPGAAACTGGLLAAAGLGLALGYRATVRHYRGENLPARAAESAHGAPERAPLTARRIPGLPEDTAAHTYALLLSYARHPRMRMLMIMPVVLAALILLARRGRVVTPDTLSRDIYLPVLLLSWPFINFASIFFNLFGMDGRALRALILLPVPRSRILLAKNLALFPFVGSLSAAFLLFYSAYAGMPLGVAVILFAAVPTLYLSYCCVGNFASVLFPYRISLDAVKGQGPSRGSAFLIGLSGMALVFVFLLPTGLSLALNQRIPPWWTPGVPSPGILLALLFLGFSGMVYAQCLKAAGRFLARREQQVLEHLVRGTE